MNLATGVLPWLGETLNSPSSSRPVLPEMIPFLDPYRRRSTGVEARLASWLRRAGTWSSRMTPPRTRDMRPCRTAKTSGPRLRTSGLLEGLEEGDEVVTLSPRQADAEPAVVEVDHLV